MNKRFAVALCALLLVFAAAVLFRTAALALVLKKAESAARSRCAHALNEAASQALASFPKNALGSVQNAGGAALFSVCAADCGALAAGAAAKAQYALESSGDFRVSYRLFELLPGILACKSGPKLFADCETTCAVTAECSSSFAGAGLNQTVYRVWLNMSAEVTLSCAGQTGAALVEARFPAAETVIIGEVPHTLASGTALSLVPG